MRKKARAFGQVPRAPPRSLVLVVGELPDPRLVAEALRLDPHEALLERCLHRLGVLLQQPRVRVDDVLIARKKTCKGQT